MEEDEPFENDLGFPLWLAICQGKIDQVKKYVKAGLKIQDEQSYNQCNEDMGEGTTPLLVACWASKYEMVRYLVEQGADVNVGQKWSGQTCLMGVCHRENYEKEKVDIIRYLVEKGADVNQRNLKGGTALHVAAAMRDGLEPAKMFFELGARSVKDNDGMTHLLVAVMKINDQMVEYLTSRPECTLAERVDALLLLGAAYSDKPIPQGGCMPPSIPVPSYTERTLIYWKRALKEVEDSEKHRIQGREQGGTPDQSSEGAQGSTGSGGPAWCPPTVEPIAACGYAVEARSVANVEALSGDGIKMQALLVRERLLGPVHSIVLKYIQTLSIEYKLSGDMARCVAMQQHYVDVTQRHLKPFESSLGFALLVQSFTDMLGAESVTSGTGSAGTLSHQQMFVEMLTVLDKALHELERGDTAIPETGLCETDHNQLRQNLPCVREEYMIYETYWYSKDAQVCHLQKIVQLIVLLEHAVRLQPDSAAALARFKSALQGGVVPLNPKDRCRGGTLLHIACDECLHAITVKTTASYVGLGHRHEETEKYFQFCRIPNPAFFEVMLEVGLDVNALDFQRNTLLHLAAKRLVKALNGAQMPSCTNAVKIVKALVRHGSHLDTRNSEGCTALELLSEVSELGKSVLGVSWLEDLCGASMSDVSL